MVELSSFQLDGIKYFKPDIGILLNITPDHLDRYDNNFSNYVASKFQITKNLTQEEVFIYCADSEPITKELDRRKIEATLFTLSATKNKSMSAFIDEDHLIFDVHSKWQKPVS